MRAAEELSERCMAAEYLWELNTLDNTQLTLKWMAHYGLREIVETMRPEAQLEFFEEWISTPSTTKETTMAMINEINNRHSASTMAELPTGYARIKWTLNHHMNVYYRTEANTQEPIRQWTKGRRGILARIIIVMHTSFHLMIYLVVSGTGKASEGVLP